MQGFRAVSKQIAAKSITSSQGVSSSVLGFDPFRYQKGETKVNRDREIKFHGLRFLIVEQVRWCVNVPLAEQSNQQGRKWPVECRSWPIGRA